MSSTLEWPQPHDHLCGGAGIYFKSLFSGNAGTVFVQVAEDDMTPEAKAERKAKGEAEVKAGLQRGGNKVRCFCCLRLNSCNHICNYFSLPRTATQCSWT